MLQTSAMTEQVKDAKSGNGNESALQPKDGQQLSLDIGSPKTWPIVVTGLSLSTVAIGGVYTIVRVASVFNEVGARATFITGSIVGLFTLLAIVAQAAIYWQQRNFMMRQWKAMQDSVDRTDTIIDKMQGQLDGMKDQARLIKQQIELNVAAERAYISLRDWKTPRFEHGYLILEAHYINGGRTPALNVCGHTRVGVDYALTKPPFPPFPSSNEEAWLDEAGFLFIAANDRVLFPLTPLKVTDEQIRLVQEGSMKIFIDGVCRYFDSLGGKQFYTYGFTLEWGGIGASPRYERHHREKANPN